MVETLVRERLRIIVIVRKSSVKMSYTVFGMKQVGF